MIMVLKYNRKYWLRGTLIVLENIQICKLIPQDRTTESEVFCSGIYTVLSKVFNELAVSTVHGSYMKGITKIE